MSRSHSLPGWESPMGEVLTSRTKSMHDRMSHERTAKPSRWPPPAFVEARGSVQIREIAKGPGDLSGREGIKTNSRRGNYHFIISTGLDILLTTAADGIAVLSFPPLARRLKLMRTVWVNAC